MNQHKRVSFNEATLSVVHTIEPLNAVEAEDLFYHDHDYERFRLDRNREVARNARKHLSDLKLLEAMRRSSIDLMEQSPVEGPHDVRDRHISSIDPMVPSQLNHPSRTRLTTDNMSHSSHAPTRRLPRRTRHSSACWREDPLPNRPNAKFLTSSYVSGVAFAA